MSKQIEAIKMALEDAKQHDEESVVQKFSGLPKRKLLELLAAGWQIDGVSFQRADATGTVRRGSITTGGRVLWWNEQPHQHEEEWVPVTQELINEQPDWIFEPVWMALKNGGVAIGRYGWAYGCNKDRLTATQRGYYFEYDATHVMPIKEPKHPLSKSTD